MEFYTYFERTENIPGYRPSTFIFDLVLRLLEIARVKAPNASYIEGIVQKSKNEFQEIINVINTTRIPRRDKSGNIIYKKTKDGLVAEEDTITFHNIATKNLLENIFSRLLPTFLVFIDQIKDRGYVNESQQANILKISGDLNQMYKNPKTGGILEKLENHLTFNIATVYNRELILEEAEDAVYLVEQLFDRKTNKGNDHDKKIYNETFRIFKKLKEYVEKIQESEGKLEEINLTQDEDDLLTSEAGLQKINPKQKIIRKLHGTRMQNFELPDFAKTFTRDPETGKYAYLRDVDTRKKGIVSIGAEKGVDTSGLQDARDFFGYTKVFNEIMNMILEQKKSGALRTLSSDDKRDLQSYFSGRKPFIQSKNKLNAELSEVSWYDRFDPFNESKWFFRKPEGFLLKTICQARVIATGQRYSYDIDLIYDEFIYLLRLFINDKVKVKDETSDEFTVLDSGEKVRVRTISLEKGADNDASEFKRIIGKYVREGNAGIRGITSGAEKITKKAAAVKRSIEIEKKKESGERALSQKDQTKFERDMKQLQNELDSITQKESDLLTDIFSMEKMDEDPEFEEKEIKDLETFALDNIRVINIKKTKNLVTPKISPKPSTDTDIKKMLSRILKRDVSEISSDDIRISKEIFAQDSNSFFNRKTFLSDYIQKLKGVSMAANSIMVTEPMDMPKKINDVKQVTEFLKKVFLIKGYKFNDEEISTAMNVLKTVDDTIIDKNYFKIVYDTMMKEKVAELELDRIEHFKKTSEKELLISDIGGLSTDMYSNNLHLQMTDLSQEIKFSHKVTGITMLLRPNNEKDTRSSGEFFIYVSRRIFDEFIKKNPYLIDIKNKNPLNNKQLIIEAADVYIPDDIAVIRGTYDSTFLPSPMLGNENQYDIRAGYIRSATTRKDFVGTSIEKMLDSARVAGAERTRLQKELLLRARKRANIMRRREAIIAGKKPKKKVTNNYLKASNSLLEFFETQKTFLKFSTDKIKMAIKEYDAILNENEKIIGPKVRQEAAIKIRNEFRSLYKELADQKNSLIYDNLMTIKKIITSRRLNYLTLKLVNNKPPVLIFDKVKYDGSYENSYDDLQFRFNTLFEKYLEFTFTKPETLIDAINQIEEASKLFNSLLNSLNEIVNLISTPEIEETYSGRSAKGMRLEKDIQSLDESVKLTEQVIKVREVGSKYQKIHVLKPNRISIIEQIIRKNEIK